MPDPVGQASAGLTAVFKSPFPEQLAFFRNKLKKLVPTARWTDVWKAGHDTGFMVAGAGKADLLSGLAAAVDKSLAQGGGIEAFRKDFDALVARHGWSYKGPRNWRTRVIYTTNAATSYAAGRLAQLRAGGFKYWIYRHTAGELHPRPLHVSWNGLTLPADSPWWKAHYPPGGWGCRCYVVGAANEAIAKRLGGRLEAPPDDGVDPKTGEPRGIDKGWGYMPGDTVSHTINEMAAKTRQWPYEIAKAYMQTVPATVRDALAESYRSLPSTADDARRYAQRIIADRTHLDIPPYQTLGLLTSDQAAQIGKLVGVDVTDYDFALDRYGIRHAENEHGIGATELPRGQRPVTGADYAKLPALVDAPDTIVRDSASRIGHPEVRLSKEIDGEIVSAIFEVRGKRKMLALQTLWIKPAPPRSIRP